MTRIGIGALRGGMMTLTPEWRQPRIAPPRASTMKDTKNLQELKFFTKFYNNGRSISDAAIKKNMLLAVKMKQKIQGGREHSIINLTDTQSYKRSLICWFKNFY